MKKFTPIFILTLIILNFCQGCVEKALQNKNYTEIINQNIGGKLICKVHYWDDFQESVNEITYEFADKDGKKHKIGTGKFEYGWNKTEQLIQFKNWTILKTSNSRESEKIIIGNLEKNLFKEYVFSPTTIEENPIWIKQNINSNPNNYDSVVKIQKIGENGQFTILYKFAIKDRTFSFQEDEKKVIYKIDEKTGIPILIKVIN